MTPGYDIDCDTCLKCGKCSEDTKSRTHHMHDCLWYSPMEVRQFSFS